MQCALSAFTIKDLWLSLDLGPRVYGYTFDIFKRVLSKAEKIYSKQCRAKHYHSK